MRPALKKLSWKHKNNKVVYYANGYLRQLLPGSIIRSELEKKLSRVTDFDADYLSKRVNYYNRLGDKAELPDSFADLSGFTLDRKNKTYYFDSYEYTRYFDKKLKAAFEFGDVTWVPVQPSIVKSRPVGGDNANSVLLNLDKIRHFTFVNDKKDFRKKKNLLVSRNHVTQPHRIRFLEMYIDHPMCDIGKINKDGGHDELLKEILTFDEQLDNKFILCLEGNDVASNLKWVMSSQSLAVMPRPKYETWFMEGSLIPDYHYVLINEDYSNLEERMEYFITHADEAQAVINNAHDYIRQFRIRSSEDLISLLVLEKYFYRTGQITVDKSRQSLYG
jgi:hypothetical protein